MMADIPTILTTAVFIAQVLSINSFLLEADDDISCGIPDIQPIANRIIGDRRRGLGHGPGFELSKNPDRWTVTAGKHNLNQVDTEQSTYHVDMIIPYPGYDNITLKNDIALIVLKEPITYSNFVRPICIPSTYRRVVPINTLCFTAGWGDTRGTANPNTLNQVALPLLHDYWCSRPDWYGASFVPRLTFCAGYASGRKDACLGDSGGPFICKVNGTWYQQGIVSWGYDCGQPRWPGIYTDVSKYRQWIKETMSNEGHPLTV